MIRQYKNYKSFIDNVIKLLQGRKVRYISAKTGNAYNTVEEAVKDNTKYVKDPNYRYLIKEQKVRKPKEYNIPFIKDKKVILTNAGLASGAVLSTNMLDTIAKHAEAAGLPINIAIALAAKESTLGNPTFDKSIYKILNPQRRKIYEWFKNGQHINNGKDIPERELINWTRDELGPYGLTMSYLDTKRKTQELYNAALEASEKYDDGRVKDYEDTYADTNVLFNGFKFYKEHPNLYNPGLPNYLELVNQRAKEIWQSPEIQEWYKQYLTNKKIKSLKQGGQIRKMLTAAGGPLRIKFTPEQIALFESYVTRVPGMNNSGGNRYREEGVLALQHLEQEAKRKEEEIKSRMEMRPTLKRKMTTAEKIRGKKDEYELKPQIVGISGADPLLSFYVGGVGLNGIGALAKTGLWNIAKYAPTTQLGNWGRGYFVGNAFKSSFNGTVPTLSSQATSLLYQPAKLNESELTSLKFFERRRPARISEAERAGVPKGDRNNKKIINPDNVYGNLRFIRNIDGLPTVKDGLVQLGNSDKLLTNFTTDLPFRLHDWYPNIPGPTYMIVSPRAFKGKKFYSIKPSDSFLSTVDSKVTPNQIRIISGDPKILEEAERRGMRTLTSDKLQDLFNVGSEITKKEFELGRNGAVRPFANADAAINDFKFRNRFYEEDIPEILSKYPEGIVTPYRAEVDKLITQNIGRPSIKDYLVLENMTGLDTGITSKFDSELIKKAKDPLANKDMFEKVYYPVTSQIEEELMNSIGLYSGPYYSFSNLLKLGKLNGNPIKYKQGGKMNILEFLKNGSGIHIKKKNRGKFTSYCGGKVTDECIRKAKASGNPTLVKRATFAANARKWKHKKGGILLFLLQGNKIDWAGMIGNFASQALLTYALNKLILAKADLLKEANNALKLSPMEYVSKYFLEIMDEENRRNEAIKAISGTTVNSSDIVGKFFAHQRGKLEAFAHNKEIDNLNKMIDAEAKELKSQGWMDFGTNLMLTGMGIAGLYLSNKGTTNAAPSTTPTTTGSSIYKLDSFWEKPYLTKSFNSTSIM